MCKPLQSRKHKRTTVATELALEFVDREASIMPFPLQDTKNDQTAGEVMHLSPLETRLTATQAELILTDSNDLLKLRPHPIEAAHLHGRQRQTVDGKVFGAVSDDQHFEAPSQPAGLRPVGMAPIGPQGLAVEPAVLLEPTD